MTSEDQSNILLNNAQYELNTHPSIEVWTEIRNELPKLSAESSSHEILEKLLKKLFSVEILRILWSNLFNIVNSKEFNAELIDLFSLLSAHRVLSNYLSESMDLSEYAGEKHVEKFVTSLLLFCYQQASIPHSFLAKVIPEFGDSFQSQFVVTVVREAYDANPLFESCSSQSALHFSILLLRKVLTNSQLIQYSNLNSVLTTLNSLSTQLFTIAEILHALFFKIKWNSVRDNSSVVLMSRYAKLIVSSFPCQELEVSYHTAQLWSERSFVSNQSMALKSLLSCTLMQCMLQLDSDSVLASINGGVSLCGLLSAGISHYLDVSDQPTRILGMRVATALSESLGHKVHFDELVKFDAVPSSSSCGGSSSSVGSEGGDNIKSYSSVGDDDAVKTHTVNDVTENVEDAIDDGSDSDLEPFEFDIDSSIETLSGLGELQTNYLTVCLAMLRTVEDKPDAAKKHLAALGRIAIIMSSEVLPYDSKDLCVPLLNQLLVMENHFNQEGFEEKRVTAINALCVSHPNLSIPVLTKCILSSECALGLRIACISYLSSAAKDLSNFSSRRNESTIDEGNDSISHLSISKSSKTTVTHPVRLRVKSQQQSKEKTVYYRNTFGAVSHLMFVPLCVLLTKQLQKQQQSVDGVLDSILPSKAFTALSIVLQCSVNTMHERRYAAEVMKLSLLYQQQLYTSATTSSRDVELKRCCLIAALHAVMLLTNKKKPTWNSIGNVAGGVLASLTHISSAAHDNDYSSGSEESGVDLNADELTLLMSLCECILSSGRDIATAAGGYDDTDEESRLIKKMIVQSVHDALKLSK